MKAMAQRTWTRGEALVEVELPTPEPKRGEVRVSVRAVGVNPVDWKMRSLGPLRLAARLVGPRPPVVVGVDFAGVVDAVGPGVSAFAPGDRVAGGTDFSRGQRGSYADTVVVRQDQICHVPEGVELEVAGALPVAGVTAHMALHQVGKLRRVPPADRRVLVLGASGGVGQLLVQLAKAEGAFVAGVCSGRNRELVLSLGADVVLDYTEGDPLDGARAHAPFSVVVDAAGGYAGARARSLLARGGRHVLVAGEDVNAVVQVLAPPFSSRLILGRPTGARLAPVLEAVARGQLRVRIDHRLPLIEAEHAHELSRTGRLTGKIVLLP